MLKLKLWLKPCKSHPIDSPRIVRSELTLISSLTILMPSWLYRGYKTKRKKETSVSEKELSSAISKTKAGVPDEHDDNIKQSSTVQGLGFK